MKDDDKTREQLVQELAELRSQNAALKKSASAEKYRYLVEDLNEVIYELDSQGVVLYMEASGTADLGRTRSLELDWRNTKRTDPLFGWRTTCHLSGTKRRSSWASSP